MAISTTPKGKAAGGLGPQTTHDLRCLGIYQAPARVIELRRRGFSITTERVTLWDRDGYPHSRAGLYRLIEEPNETAGSA